VTAGVVLAGVLAYPALRRAAPIPRAAFSAAVALWSVPLMLFTASPAL
jgi:hypothetical protein